MLIYITKTVIRKITHKNYLAKSNKIVVKYLFIYLIYYCIQSLYILASNNRLPLILNSLHQHFVQTKLSNHVKPISPFTSQQYFQIHIHAISMFMLCIFLGMCCICSFQVKYQVYSPLLIITGIALCFILFMMGLKI